MQDYSINELIEKISADTVKRKKNGYRVYDANDIKRLKIIRSLRYANYSLSAILRMLKKYDSGMNEDILSFLTLIRLLPITNFFHTDYSIN